LSVLVKSPREIAGIRSAGRIVAETLTIVATEVRVGVTLRELSDLCERYVRNHGATPTFLGYRGFPAPVCVSINNEVVHGIPDSRVLVEGDIVKVDVEVTKDGFIADAARTFGVGRITPEVRALVAATEESFWLGAAEAHAGNRVTDISHAIQVHVESRGYSSVRDLCGHGVGLKLHEEPSIPNFGPPHRGPMLAAGMTLAIEPMVNMGRYEVDTTENGWTVVATDGLPSAHYENTVLVTDDGCEILTLAVPDGRGTLVGTRHGRQRHV